MQKLVSRWGRTVVSCLALVFAGLTPVLAQPDRNASASDLNRFTTNRAIAEASRRVFSFPDEGVFFSTDFEGARLDRVERTERAREDTRPYLFTATVAPENAPINDSGWYAFKVWSTGKKEIRITLAYEDGRHRYPPQISRDGESWERLPLSETSTSSDRSEFTFTLQVGPEPLYVSGQELFTSEDFARWIEGLERHLFVRAREFGQSTLGKPIRLLEIGEAGPEAEYVLIVGRQHPPEVTGTFALREFVQTLCEDTPLARSFRQRFKTIVVPLVNPDGVDAGHWRHNARGVDLNRDWGQFNQQETRLIRDEFLRLKQAAPGRIRFGLDFHSTRKDVFYVTSNEDDPARQWLRALQQRVPEYKVVIEGSPTPARSMTLTAAAWMRNVLGIPSLTYESGDTTERDLIAKVADAGANALMNLLLEPRAAVAGSDAADFDAHFAEGAACGRIRVALYKGAGTGGKGPPNLLRHLNGGTNAVIKEVSPEEIRGGVLTNFDVVIFAGGSASKQAETIGENGREQVVDFIRNGGGYIGICAGAYLATSGFSWGLKVLDARTASPLWRRGVGEVRIELTEAGRRMLRDTDQMLEVHYANGPILVPCELAELEDYEPLAYFRTELAKNDTPEGLMINSPAAVAGRFGKGRVVCFSPHPEQTKGLEDFVEKALGWIKDPAASQ